MVTIYRIWKSETETIGRLYINGIPFCFTLELPWKDNQQQISCIPDGKYHCIWQRSPKFGWTYQVTEVPGRSRILIHSGNLPRHTYGCILLGKHKGSLEGKNAVLYSKPTVRAFAEALHKAPFELEVL